MAASADLLEIDNTPLPEPSILAKQPNHNWSRFNSEERIIQAAISYDTRHRGESPCSSGVSALDLASLDRAVLERLPLQRIGEAAKVGIEVESEEVVQLSLF